jgi:hypothetical protein
MRGEGIVPVMEVGNNNSGFGGFGNNGDWAWIIILFLIMGWGRNGNGYGGGSSIGDGYVLASDFATLQRQLSDGFNSVNRKNDAIQEGICDATFSLNNTINTGFFGVQNSLTQGFAGLNTALLQGNYALSSQLADCCCGVKTQLADCCCRIERGIDGINYNNALQTSTLQQTLCNNTRDIIENQNANYRAIHEELVANKLEAKNDRIAELTAQVNKLQLSASQERQNNYLISQLGDKCPVPAYVVNGPTPVNFPTNCCGTFNGYGCNNGCGNY